MGICIPRCTTRLAASIVLIHGGMAQDVGPILEMVTEKYLLRAGPEWAAREQMRQIFDDLIANLQRGDLRGVGACTTRNWDGPLRTIIPRVTNHFTETIISRTRVRSSENSSGASSCSAACPAAAWGSSSTRLAGRAFMKSWPN